MAEDEIFYLRKETVVNMQIRTANGGRCDAQDNIARTLGYWIIDVVDLDVSGADEKRGLSLFPTQSRRRPNPV